MLPVTFKIIQMVPVTSKIIQMLPVIFKIIQYLHVTYKIIKNYTHSICHIQIHLKSITHTLNLNVYLVLTI